MGCVNGKFSNDEKKLGERDERNDARNEILINPVFRVDHPVHKSLNCEIRSSNAGKNNVDSRNHQCSDNNKISGNRKHGDKEKVAKFGGEITSKYEFKGFLGKGTWSSVWRVENRRTKQPYAIKIAKGEEGRSHLDDEIVILSRLRHPNIVQFVEVLRTSDHTFMVMELATGGDLFDRVYSRGPFTERDAIRVLKMVLEGIKYLHASGITHRDLKPDNLLFYHPGPNSRILITDFALSRRPERPTKGSGQMDTICGTPEYMAPEIIGRRLYTCSVDMWAVGVITFAILSDSFPFSDDTLIKVYQLILGGQYSYKDKVWDNIKDGAKDFINRLLKVEPQSRMSAAQALKHPWIRSRTGNVDEHGMLQRAISSSSSSGSSSRSSHSGSLSSTRRRRRKQMKQHEMDLLQNDPEWNLLRQRILVSAGNSPAPLASTS